MKIAIYIISHKTRYANLDETRTNLRKAALNWMTQHHFFDSQHLGLKRSNVFFESTRIEKIARIKKLGCTHFIDDLEETFMETSFPANVKKILYAAHPSPLLKIKRVTAWKEIYDYFFVKKT